MPIVGQRFSTTIDNFATLIRSDLIFVDKSLMIQEIIEDPENAILITRPRRFGKTLNMSMLQHFFAAEVNGQLTKGLFDNLEISQVENGRYIQEHQGKYPVIFITFKDIKQDSFENALKSLSLLIQELYSEHRLLLTSNKLEQYEKDLFTSFLMGCSEPVSLQGALKILTTCLWKVHEKKVIILIDEYDTPLTSAYTYDHLSSLSEFMRNFLSGALKSNPLLEKGIMTGILRVSKNAMLSGLNNLKTRTVLDKKYSQYFGFTETETKELLQSIDALDQLEAVKDFYNGYHIGDQSLYNPWSMMSYLSEDHELRPYWVLTSNDKVLKDILVNSSDETKEKLALLMKGEINENKININLRYEELMEDPGSLWTLLLFCGYLKSEHSEFSIIDGKQICQLKIPNVEIMQVYNSVFSEWLEEKLGGKYDPFLRNLTEGQVEKFTRDLGDYLIQSLSFRDVGGDKVSERFYHGFTLGLIASLRQTHHVYSNRESGYGLYDVMLVPKSPAEHRGIILEFKYAKTTQNIADEAQKALQQIDARLYATELAQYPHIKTILKVGLAFCAKSAISAYQETHLTEGKAGSIILSPELFRDNEA